MTRSRLCETVVGTTLADLLSARDAVLAADMMELRLDGVAGLDVATALGGRHLPVVVTCRPTWEGGRFDGAEAERARVLAEALERGADYVDIEWRALRESAGAAFTALVSRHPDRVVLSSHDFDGVPHDLDARVHAMRAVGAGTIKIAVAVSRLTDTLILRRVAEGGPAVVIGMGEAGLPTRLLPARFGSVWTYAGHAVAPGQIPAGRMVDEFRFRDVGPATRIFGIVGSHAGQSFSPVMHNAAFAAAGCDAVYVPLRPEDFADFLAFADALGCEGASVTIPYKLDALRAAASADEAAREVGAANTLRRSAGGWDATNTDVAGFLAPLGRLYPGGMAGVRAAVIGAGGAARAVVVALRAAGAGVTVHARREGQASEVAEALGVGSGPWPVAPASWDLLVNTTPLGGAGHRGESPMPDGSFDGGVVYDLTYGPEPSPLIRDARVAGCRTLDGLPMLVAQAERQFAWWTGSAPPAGVMAAAARRCVGGARAVEFEEA